ncbi:hypothetical protein MKX03_004460 [Papaver bracteatum]|nr:hypothetical protein MKX03_004460 [Papaver bracteatum]
MASSSKIHIFRKSAIEAGTPEKYYLNPSENLWKITSAWDVVELEDVLVLTMDSFGIGDLVMTMMDGKFINTKVLRENKEIAARFDDKEGMKKFSIEMNPNFLELAVKLDPTLSLSQGVKRMFISKIKAAEGVKVTAV